MQTRLMIYGSCVARDIVRIAGERFKLTDYIARQNLISAFSGPVPIPDDWGVKSSFQRRSLQSDFNGDAAQRIRKHSTETDIFLWDLGSERHGVYSLVGESYISATPTQRASPGVANITSRKLVAFGTEQHFQLFSDAARKLRGVLQESQLWEKARVIGFPFTDRIAEGGNLEKKRSASELNSKHEPYYELLKDLGFKFLPPLPDEYSYTTQTHTWGAGQNHYLDTAYEWWARQIEDIQAGVTGNIIGEDRRLEDLPIHYSITDRLQPESMVVLMPAALSSKREDRKKKYFTRFRWESEWPESEVISFADPALQQDERLNGAWYIHPEHDILKTISEIVVERAETKGIPHNRIVFYGSSLGGFGAIGAAAHILGARAVAEVAQIDVANWLPGAIRSIENYIIGMPLEEYRAIHPEQLSLKARFTAAGRIPGLMIITNSEDTCFGDQCEFFQWIKDSDLPADGPVEMLNTTRVSGHRVLKRSEAVSYIHP